MPGLFRASLQSRVYGGVSSSPALQRAGLAPLGLLLPLEVLLPSREIQSLNPGITAQAFCHFSFPGVLGMAPLLCLCAAHGVSSVGRKVILTSLCASHGDCCCKFPLIVTAGVEEGL